jgi:hypothetical protein
MQYYYSRFNKRIFVYSDTLTFIEANTFYLKSATNLRRKFLNGIKAPIDKNKVIFIAKSGIACLCVDLDESLIPENTQFIPDNQSILQWVNSQ